MFHTCFFGAEEAAASAYAGMKEGLASIVALIPTEGELDEDARAKITAAIEEFVERHS